MKTSIVLTVLAADRPGLVSDLSTIARNHSANWVNSKMSRLAGRFAGLVHLEVMQQQLDSLITALKDLQNQGIQIHINHNDESAPMQAHSDETLVVELLGQDREGIIKDISQQLAILGINITELLTEQRTASMSNEILFFAKITVVLPETISADDVQTQLEAMSDQFMVDIVISS